MTAPTFKHTFVSALSDQPDATDVRPSDWNADHQMMYGALPFYEEGVWTPVLTCDTPGTLVRTYTNQFGQWTRVGRQVSVSFRLDLATFTLGTASGAVRIGGLPYLSNNTFAGFGTGMTNGIDLGGANVGFWLSASLDYMHLFSTNDNGAWEITPIANVSVGDGVIGTITYFR